MKIDIRVTEILSKIVTVDALSVNNAIIFVEDMYKKEEIVLDYSNFEQEVIIEKKEDRFMSKKDLLISKIIESIIKDEQKHYEELGKPDNHIYLTLLSLQKQI